MQLPIPLPSHQFFPLFGVFHDPATFQFGYCVHHTLTATLTPNCPCHTTMLAKTTINANVGCVIKNAEVSRTWFYHAWYHTMPATMPKSWNETLWKTHEAEDFAARGAAGALFCNVAGAVVPGYIVFSVVKPRSSYPVTTLGLEPAGKPEGKGPGNDV
jgi:hypothetical protein